MDKLSKIRTHTETLKANGVDPKLAKQAAIVIANDDLFGLLRTPRGQRIVRKAHSQVNVEKEDEV
jgi:hypothetical protein